MRTVEGLAGGDALHAVQDALVAPGRRAVRHLHAGHRDVRGALIESEPDASRARLRELLAGNICRCTGYQLIVDAVAEVAEQAKRGGS